ncbi:hypothetical protein [Spiroplasma endosymbiont of Apeira syringaria]|uniref:hypothetical protein n=1 Tax=Spiroplasma endosymbiont of Apeira syringaria TaxID=3066307 RepID=UPI0030CADE93
MQDIAVQFEKHCWIHSVSLFPPQVHVGRSPKRYWKSKCKMKYWLLYWNKYLTCFKRNAW